MDCTAPILGFTGKHAEKRALRESRVTPPRVYVLPDGSLVGVGKTFANFIGGSDYVDTHLHGAHLTMANMSDFDRKGGKQAWLDLTGVERARQRKRLAR